MSRATKSEIISAAQTLLEPILIEWKEERREIGMRLNGFNQRVSSMDAQLQMKAEKRTVEKLAENIKLVDEELRREVGSLETVIKRIKEECEQEHKYSTSIEAKFEAILRALSADMKVGEDVIERNRINVSENSQRVAELMNLAKAVKEKLEHHEKMHKKILARFVALENQHG